MLRDNGVLDAALQLDLKGRNGHEKLMERVAVGYLWGEDTLDSSRFKFIFESKAEEALAQINFFFWTIRGEKLKEDQVHRILQYWRRCLEWAASQPTPPIKVLSSLSGLASFVPDVSGDKQDLLLNTAPYVHEHHGAYDFLKELRRLVEGSPKEVCTVLRKFIETHGPMYDYEDRMRKLVARLAELGHRAEAIEFCDKLQVAPRPLRVVLGVNGQATGCGVANVQSSEEPTLGSAILLAPVRHSRDQREERGANLDVLEP